MWGRVGGLGWGTGRGGQRGARGRPDGTLSPGSPHIQQPDLCRSASPWLSAARPLGFSRMVFRGRLGTAPRSAPGIVRAPPARLRSAQGSAARPRPLPPRAARAAAPPPSGAAGSWLRVLSGCALLSSGRRESAAARPPWAGREGAGRGGGSDPGPAGVGGAGRQAVAKPGRAAPPWLLPARRSAPRLARAPGTPAWARARGHRDPSPGG